MVAVPLVVAVLGAPTAVVDAATTGQRVSCANVRAGLTGSVELSLQTKWTGKEKVRARASSDSLLRICYSLAWDDSIGVAEEERVDVSVLESTGNPLDATVAVCAGIRLVVDGPVTGFVHVSLVAEGDYTVRGAGLNEHDDASVNLRRDIDATSDEEIVSGVCLSSDGSASAI